MALVSAVAGVTVPSVPPSLVLHWVALLGCEQCRLVLSGATPPGTEPPASVLLPLLFWVGQERTGRACRRSASGSNFIVVWCCGTDRACAVARRALFPHAYLSHRIAAGKSPNDGSFDFWAPL